MCEKIKEGKGEQEGRNMSLSVFLLIVLVLLFAGEACSKVAEG